MPADLLALCTNANFVAECLDESAANKAEIAASTAPANVSRESLQRWSESESSAARMIRRLTAVIQEFRDREPADAR